MKMKRDLRMNEMLPFYGVYKQSTVSFSLFIDKKYDKICENFNLIILYKKEQKRKWKI